MNLEAGEGGKALGRRAWLQWLAALPLVPEVWAQNKSRVANKWPQKTVNLVVPFPAGGSSALLAKPLSLAFQRQTSKPMRLEYRGGAGGVSGSSYIAAAPSDGYHLLVGGSHLVKARALMLDVDFDVLEDLTPLVLMAHVPQLLLVNPTKIRARNVTELLSELRRKSSRYRMASAGVGSSSHIASEVLRQQEELNFEFVHFRGSGPALQDLLMGSVDMMMDGLASALPHVRNKKLKALLVTGPQRIAALPDVPCAVEMGVQVLESLSWYGLFAPKKISEQKRLSILEVIDQLGEDTELRESYESMGIRWLGLGGAAFENMLENEARQWAQRLKQLKLDNRAAEDGRPLTD